MTAPTVSIVVNNYNYARFLGAAIDSALAQTHPRTEVVVVDDGSTDDSREVIAAYGARVTPVLKANGGQASAFNAGLPVTRGEVVLFLDADDLLLPTAVATAIPLFADPAVVNVHWPLWMVDADGHRTAGVLPERPLAEGDLRDVVIRDGPDSYQGVPTSGNAWSRRFLGRVLPAPEPEYRHGADGYLITVAPLYGRVRTLGEPQGCYRVHGGNQFWCDGTSERVERSLVRYERRSRTLSQHLREAGVDHAPDDWRRRNPYFQWLSRLRRVAERLREAIPAGATYLLADEGQWGADPVAGRRAVPFPEHDGLYWGPPPDDAVAIAELERQRRSGAAFVVVGWPAFWWLDHYVGLREHLVANCRRVVGDDDLVVFDIRTPTGRPRGMHHD
jgi:glycosyltransferase involved in cell wall biosynthesis